MRQFVAIACLSVLAFAAGYGVRIWVDQTRPLPAPPPIGAEFADGNQAVLTDAAHVSYHGANRQELASEIARLKPQIDAFHRRLVEIDTDCDKAMRALLTPEQLQALDARAKRHASAPSKGTGPLSDREIYWLREQPLFYAVDHVSVEYKVNDLDKDLHFTPEQKAKVRELFNIRRDRFISLVDDVPPTSLTLVWLAHVAQRLGPPQAASEATH